MDYCGPRGIALDDFLSWPQRSQDAALEWQARERRRCGECGTDPVEWADNPRAYHAHLSDQCPGCLTKHRLTERTKDTREPGVSVVLPQLPAADCPRCKPR